MIRFRPLLLLFASLIAACDDPAQPAPPVVQFSARQVETRLTGIDGQHPGMSCRIAITVEASEDVLWTGVDLSFHYGADEELVDSVSITPFELQIGDGIFADHRWTTHWHPVWPFPFRVVARIGYDATHPGSDTFDVDCGVEDYVGAPPRFESFTVDGPSTPRRGDTLDVAFEVSGAVPLWRTRMLVSGAVSDTIDFPEYMRNQGSRIYHYAIPSEAEVGQPIDLRLVVMDVEFQSDTSRTWSTPPLTDP